MLGLQTLDVIIGLIVVYLLLALVCTAINEWLSNMFSMKAKTLWEAVHNMIAKGESHDRPFFTFAFLNIFPKKDHDDQNRPTGKVYEFYAHPLIESLSQKGKLPSYISAETFRSVFMNMNKVHIPSKDDFEMVKASVSAIQDPRLNSILGSFIQNAELAENKVQHFNKQVEGWFDECMERAGGWYKRQIQAITFVFAGIMVCLFNVDSVKLTRQLWTNAPMREAFVNFSQQVTKAESVDALKGNITVTRGGKASLKQAPTTAKPAPISKDETKPVARFDEPTDETTNSSETTGNDSGYSDAEMAQNQNEEADSMAIARSYGAMHEQMEQMQGELQIPIGWETEKWDKISAYRGMELATYILGKIVGLFMSIAAASMGAPFWFSALKSVSNLRNSVAEPAK
ncbi:MAG: hypothetical protein RI894_376 [Bacteroidota bacterium]|jgi:hypothetical protein